MGGSQHGDRPKSIVLLWLVENHHDGFAFDWRKQFGLSLTSIFDGSLMWRESWAYAQEILRDPDSHTSHSISGSTYVPAPAERIGIALFEAELNSKRAKNTVAIKIARPWASVPGAVTTRLVAQDNPERLAALARLQKLTPDSPQGAPDI